MRPPFKWDHDNRIKAMVLWTKRQAPGHVADIVGCTTAELVDIAARERWPQLPAHEAGPGRLAGIPRPKQAVRA